MTPFAVRLLVLDDAEDFVRLRARALREEPLAFSSSPADDRARDPDDVRAYLGAPDRQALLGVFAPTLVGAAGIRRETQLKNAHKAYLWGMYVAPEHRRRGAGDALLAAAVAHARTLAGVQRILLAVSEAAPAARRLYERAGFVRWGTEEAGLCHEGRMIAEHHMALVL